jgi:hypothetical protein
MSKRYNILIGCSILAIILLISLVMPCPSNSQYIIFRIIISVGVGALAAIIPGFITIRYKNVIRAGSGIALMLVFYKYNPILLDTTDRCNVAFDYTIRLKPAKSYPDYPPAGKASLCLHLDNRSDCSAVDAAQQEADFKQIPASFKDRSMEVEYKNPYWKLLKDTIGLSGASTTLLIEPNGTLGEVEGRILDIDNAYPIPNARIELAGLTTASDSGGDFHLSIPVEKQRVDYEVFVTKKGYTSYQGHSLPANQRMVTIDLIKAIK